MTARMYFVAVFLMLVGVVATTYVNVECKDKLSNCNQYLQYACEAPYVIWAKDNCAKRCNLCPPTTTAPPTTTTTTTTATTTTTSTCRNKLSNCWSYLQDACEMPYLSWAKANCAKRCNLCAPDPTPKPLTTTTTTTPKPKPEVPKCWQNWVGHIKGETWRNGCKEKCTCLDPNTNSITCSPLCWNWSSAIASGDCFMTPAPKGKCCPLPKCQPPSGLLLPNHFTFE